MILEHSNYRHYLKSELANRVASNPVYSLRAFAKHLQISPAFLSLILAGKKKLALETGLKVAGRLGFNAQESEYFGLLVQIEGTSDENIKVQLLERLQNVNSNRKTTDLTVDMFRFISDWYHYGILMLTELDDFDFTPDNISARLKVNRFEVDAAISRLLELGFLEEAPDTPKKYRRAKGDLMVSSMVPNEGLRKYHRQLLELAIQSLDSQTPMERLVGSEVVAIGKSQLQEANEILEEFFAKMLKLSQKNTKKTDVYHIGAQIFNLSKERGEM